MCVTAAANIPALNTALAHDIGAFHRSPGDCNPTYLKLKQDKATICTIEVFSKLIAFPATDVARLLSRTASCGTPSFCADEGRTGNDRVDNLSSARLS